MLRALSTLVVGLAAAALLAEPPRKHRGPKDSPPLLPRKELLLVIGSGFRQMLADYYWIQTTLQTGKASNRYEYRDIYWYADLATDLDPRFRHVYVFGSTAVTFNLGRETWVNTEESTRLVRKGLEQFPDDVYLLTILGYNLSYYHAKPLDAAKVLERASRLPGAPSHLAPLATRLFAQAGRFDDGLAMAKELATSATDAETRAFFEKRVKEIELERVLRDVDAALQRFKQRSGRPASTVAELLASGDLERVPHDPLGGTIIVGEDGRSRSTAVESRLEIHGGFSNTEQEQRQ